MNRNRLVVARSWVEEWRVTAHGEGVSVWDDENCFQTRQMWKLHNTVSGLKSDEPHAFKLLILHYVNFTSILRKTVEPAH